MAEQEPSKLKTGVRFSSPALSRPRRVKCPAHASQASARARSPSRRATPQERPAPPLGLYERELSEARRAAFVASPARRSARLLPSAWSCHSSPHDAASYPSSVFVIWSAAWWLHVGHLTTCPRIHLNRTLRCRSTAAMRPCHKGRLATG